MAETFQQFLDAVRCDDTHRVGSLLESMEPEELLLSLNLLGPDEVKAYFPVLPSGKIRNAAELLDSDGLFCRDKALKFKLEMLCLDYRISQPVMIEEDPTGLLPAPNRGAPRLTNADYATAASELGVEAAAIHAVSHVESGGRTGFDSAGRPKILFEAHIFHRMTRGRYYWTHPHLSQPSQGLGKAFYGLDQWSRMYQAMMLDPVAAWSSASWGVFQIMGFNHNGSPDVRSFVGAMFKSEMEHLRSFLAYCRENHLIQFMKNHDWAGFAQNYNGAGYASNQYDTKMAAAYAQYK